MKYTASIQVDSDQDNIRKLFAAETKEFQNNRASYRLSEGKPLKFIIKAKDASALRAILNSISKNLAIYEKVKWIQRPKKE